MSHAHPPLSRPIAGLLAALLAGGAPVAAGAAPAEGCTAGPAEAIRSGDLAAAEKALRAALNDGACAPVAPELRLRLAHVLADAHGGQPGPACEAMGLFRRIAAESDDPLVESDAAHRADKLTPICAGEAPAPAEPKPAPGPGAPADPGAVPPEPAPGVDAPPPEPPREPGTTEWVLVGSAAAGLAVGGLLIGLSMRSLTERDEARADYLAAPFGSAAEAAAADRFHDAQGEAQLLLGLGAAAAGVGAALGLTAAAMWPDRPDAPAAALVLGPGGLGLVGRW